MATVTTYAELATALSARDPDILVANSFDVTTTITINYALLLRGNEGVTIRWTRSIVTSQTMFTLTAAANLTLRQLTIDGDGRNVRLISVGSGTFTMEDGAVLKNLFTTTAMNAVRVEGGTFNMNGGLITGVDAADSVFANNGTIYMGGNAAIEGNRAAGITMMLSKLTMSGKARISNNTSKQSGGGGLFVESEIIMGVAEGDEPSVTGNSNDYTSGGFFLGDGSSLTMRYGSYIAENRAKTVGGGVGAQYSTLRMMENAAIRDNHAESDAGGVILSVGASLIMEGNSRVSGNEASAQGVAGGICLQRGATLTMRENSAISGNSAGYGAGLYISASTATIGELGQAPSITGNNAAEFGGGVYISEGSNLYLRGGAEISGNTAQIGKGVYKLGELHVANSAKILDGLFYDAIPQPEGPAIVDLPLIEEGLAADSRIVLESSEYVAPVNLPLAIAEQEEGSPALTEADLLPWVLPETFSTFHKKILSDDSSLVLVVLGASPITYLNLNGVASNNPDSYEEAQLPITLNTPERRLGYKFRGWRNMAGEMISAIPLGTTGSVTLTAVWDACYLVYNENASQVSNVPASIRVQQNETVMITSVVPVREGYIFVGWNTSPAGDGVSYLPGDSLAVGEDSITVYAQWQPIAPPIPPAPPVPPAPDPDYPHGRCIPRECRPRCVCRCMCRMI